MLRTEYEWNWFILYLFSFVLNQTHTYIQHPLTLNIQEIKCGFDCSICEGVSWNGLSLYRSVVFTSLIKWLNLTTSMAIQSTIQFTTITLYASEHRSRAGFGFAPATIKIKFNSHTLSVLLKTLFPKEKKHKTALYNRLNARVLSLDRALVKLTE